MSRQFFLFLYGFAVLLAACSADEGGRNNDTESEIDTASSTGVDSSADSSSGSSTTVGSDSIVDSSTGVTGDTNTDSSTGVTGDTNTDSSTGAINDSDTGTVEDSDTQTGVTSDTETVTGGDSDNGTDAPMVSVPGDPHYKVDQFGYLPGEAKVAVISQAQEGQFSPDDFEPGATLEIRTYPGDEVVFSGNPVLWNNGETDSFCGDMGWWFDFSTVQNTGDYRIYDPTHNLYSHVFRIAENVYNVALYHALRVFFYQRLGIEKRPEHAFEWADAACLMQDSEARFIDDETQVRDVSGGWMDAGDYPKYVTEDDMTIGVLLSAYQQRPEAWGDNNDIPESGNGIPDLLDELMWEIKFLKKMQDTDGGVFIKAGDMTSQYVYPPSAHTETRYYGRKSSAATIVVAGVFAHAAYVFKDIPALATEAEELKTMAEKAWDHFHSNPIQEDVDHQEIKSVDADRSEEDQLMEAVRAAIWLFAVADDAERKSNYHSYFLENYPLFDVLRWWGPFQIEDKDALLFYTTLPEADESVKADIESALPAPIGGLARYYGFKDNGADDSALYRSYFDYNQWGSNHIRANVGVLNMTIALHNENSPDYETLRKRALETIHWFHGVNPLGLVWMTNMGDYGAENSVNEIYHYWFQDGSEWDNALTGIGPAPGYLPGGPCQQMTDNVPEIASQPPSKKYITDNFYPLDGGGEVAYVWAENSNDYQAALIRMLSYFASDSK